MWFSERTPEEVLEALETEFAKRKQRNSSYSLRAFARDLEVEHSALWRVMKRKREISWPMAKTIIEKLKL